MELSSKTTHQVLLDTAARFPKHDALIVRHQNLCLSWSDLAGSDSV